jgi:hypothetical protein
MQTIMKDCNMHNADEYEELKLRFNDAALLYDNTILFQYYIS